MLAWLESLLMTTKGFGPTLCTADKMWVLLRVDLRPRGFAMCMLLFSLPQKITLPEVTVFRLLISFVAVPHSVSWRLCWTFKRHMCSFTLASVKLGRHMFALFFPPVGSWLSDSAVIFQVVCFGKIFSESPVFELWHKYNYKEWFKSFLDIS